MKSIRLHTKIIKDVIVKDYNYIHTLIMEYVYQCNYTPVMKYVFHGNFIKDRILFDCICKDTQ